MTQKSNQKLNQKWNQKSKKNNCLSVVCKKVMVLCFTIVMLVSFAGCDMSKNSGNNASTQNESSTPDVVRPAGDLYYNPVDMKFTEVQKDEQTRFDQWLDEQFLDTLKDMDTLNRHYLIEDTSGYGLKETLSDINLGHMSVEEMKKDVEENKKCKKELLAFDRNDLTKEQQITYDVLKFYLEIGLDGEGFEYYDAGLSPTLGVPANLPVTLAEFPIESMEDTTVYLSCLEQVPDYFEEMIAFEKELAAEGMFISDDVLEDSLKQMRDFIAKPDENYLITTFAKRIDAIPGMDQKQKEDAVKQNEESVKKYVIPAYQNMIDELSKLKGTGKNSGGLCNFEKGKEYYSYLTRYYTCSDMSVEEVKGILKDRIDNLMLRLRKTTIAHPSLYTEFDSISYDFDTPEKALEYLKNEAGKYYPMCDNVSYEIKEVDESLAESLSPAFYMIPQIDNYEKNTIYINDKNSNYSESSLFPTLAHEGFPGHLLQTTYYNSTNPHPIRQVMNYGGYAEGWATYVELGSYEMYNYGDNDDALTDMNQIETEFSLCLSALADIGVNYEGWDKMQLTEFLDEYNMGETETVNSVYNLVVEDPGNYLQYYVSYLEFWNLRCKAKSQLKDQFDIKEFHKVLLDAGPSPFTVLEKLVDDYVDEKLSH